MALPALVCDLGQVEYRATAALQRSLRRAREYGDVQDTLLVLEHDPVITAGYRTEAGDIALAQRGDIPVVPTERGGKATYHGPGQIVVYPIFDLRGHGQDVRAFVRGLEQALIDVCHEYGVAADRRDAYPGVWVADRKIASIGLRVTRWVSLHGIALNVDCDLQPFSWFTPCGIPEVTMTSLGAELGAGRCPRWAMVRQHLVERVAEIFELELEQVSPRDLAIVAARHPVEEQQLSLPGAAQAVAL
jgi:lipoate-protein ligase B